MIVPSQIQEVLRAASGLVNNSLTSSNLCGTGAAQVGLNAAIAAARQALSSAIGSAQNLVSAVNSIPSLIAAQINAAAAQLANAVGNIPSPLGGTLQQEIANLLRLINNPVAFAAQYLRIQGLYPNIDLNRLLQQIAQGSGFCSLISIAAGGSSQPSPATTNAQPSPPPAAIPAAPTPSQWTNAGALTQAVLVQQLFQPSVS